MSSLQSKLSQYQNEVLNGTEIGNRINSLKNNYNSFGESSGSKGGNNGSGSSKSDGDTGSIDGGGKPGIFDTDDSFSKWFVSIADAMARYFGIKEMSMQALMALYMVAPEFSNQFRKFISKIAKTND